MFSQLGMHQGDSSGPLGFALGPEEALDCCEEEARALDWGVWYLDDGHLVGEVSAVLAYLGKFQGALASRAGLELNPAKCVMWGPGSGDLVRAGLSSRLPCQRTTSAAGLACGSSAPERA